MDGQRYLCLRNCCYKCYRWACGITNTLHSYIYVYYIYTYIYIFHASPGYRIERPKRVVSHYHTEGPENGKNSDTLGTTPTDQRTQNKERKGINHSFIDWSDFWMVWYGL